MTQAYELVKKYLLLTTIQLLCIDKVLPAVRYHIIKTSNKRADLEEKVNAQRKWIVPTHKVPIIECNTAPRSCVGVTLMFLARGFQKTGPCIKYETDEDAKALNETKVPIRNFIRPPVTGGFSANVLLPQLY